MRHGVRLNERRLRQLGELWRAGERGLPVLLTREVELFVDEQLAERFTDPTRALAERIRITALGVRYAEVLCYREEQPQ